MFNKHFQNTISHRRAETITTVCIWHDSYMGPPPLEALPYIQAGITNNTLQAGNLRAFRAPVNRRLGDGIPDLYE